jgi:hypothetical protein
MTSHIAEELHPELALLLLLWSLIDKNELEANLDYLQVFELSVEGNKQGILHRQEKPPFKQHWIIELELTDPITSTIWCIDNGETQMMLSPSDY